MSSSGDDGGGGYPGMFGAATPMPGLPVAGKDSTIGDPYEYGKFQNFLPDIKAEGPNDAATGLRPEMFQYHKPTGVKDPRDELAQVMPPAAAPANNPQWAALRAQMSPQDIAMFQRQVSPAEFASFMSATPDGGGGGGVNQTTPHDTWTNAS